MTPEIESAIEQREAMIAKAKANIEAAEEAIANTADEGAKLANKTYIAHRKVRIAELKDQIRILRGKPAEDEPLTAS